jgi:prevent-host-death family protein
MARKPSSPLVRHLPLTQFRQRVGEVINRVHREKEYVVVERGGLPVAAVMDIDEFEDYLEVRDPEAQRDVAASREDIAAGRIRPVEELLTELESEDVRDRPPASRRV